MNNGCLSPRSKGKKIRSGAFHLTQMVDYGLFFLAILGKENASRSIRSIANEYDLSFAFLQKTANRLKRAGLVSAERGKDGGYSLAKTVFEISMQEIIEALEGPVAVMDCLLPNTMRVRVCPRGPVCTVRNGLARLNEHIKAYTSSKSLAEFIS